MSTPIIMFRILFFLGAAPELSVKNLESAKISKHRGNHVSAVKLNKWNGRRYR